MHIFYQGRGKLYTLYNLFFITPCPIYTQKMKTEKQIEKEHTNCFAVGYNVCRKDVKELIDNKCFCDNCSLKCIASDCDCVCHNGWINKEELKKRIEG